MMRHGDVQLIRIESLPSDAVLVPGRKALAFGEKTGHQHRIDVGELFETKNGELYLKVDSLCQVSHEEHETKVIEPGIYRVGIKRQYTPDGGWANVTD